MSTTTEDNAGVGPAYLDDAGGHVYLFTTDMAVWIGLLGWTEYRERIECLREMLDPGATLHLLLPRKEQVEVPLKAWPSDEGDALSPGLELVSESGSSGPGGPRPSEPFTLSLITTQSGVLGAKWIFHQNDSDFFPSVPHGHLMGAPKSKLDAYRGYTYDTANGKIPLTRETRRFIVGLWNDEKFRVLARSALDYFCSQNPGFHWGPRGIVSPLRLPRRR